MWWLNYFSQTISLISPNYKFLLNLNNQNNAKSLNKFQQTNDKVSEERRSRNYGDNYLNFSFISIN